MKAWLFQDSRQLAKHGASCPWSVCWIDPAGVKRSKSVGAKSLAEKFKNKIQGQLAAGTYDATTKASWSTFRQEYDAKILAGKGSGDKGSVTASLKHFERLAKPQRVSAITTATIDGFIAKRRTERGRKRESTVSPATVNANLRDIKAVLGIARDWKYLAEVPKFRWLPEDENEPTYATPEHFQAIYDACGGVVDDNGETVYAGPRLPKGLPYPPGDWWKALIAFCYMTGWRVGEPLSVRRDDVDASGVVRLKAKNTKGHRAETMQLHPIILEHLEAIASFEPMLFPWPHNRRTLWAEFLKIQQAAGIHLPCDGDHVHTPSCHVYGFHDFRRAFATENAATHSSVVLQRMMRHKNASTTLRYINMANAVQNAVESVYVPPGLAKRVGS